MNKKDNARSRRSRELIRNALLMLLEHQELSELTVSQLCRQAGVNRSTFYAHYADLWAVMQELEDEMDQALLDQFRWVEDAQSAMLDRRSLLILTQQIQMHPRFYRARISNPSITARRMELGMKYIMEHIVLPYVHAKSHNPMLPYYVCFVRAGILEVLQAWIKNGCQESAEDVAALLYDLCMVRLLEIDPNESRINTGPDRQGKTETDPYCRCAGLCLG